MPAISLVKTSPATTPPTTAQELPLVPEDAAPAATRSSHRRPEQPNTWQIAAGRAAMHTTGLWSDEHQASPIPVAAWEGRPDGSAQAVIDNGSTVITYTPGQPLTASTRCHHSKQHTTRILTTTDLRRVRASAINCTGHQAPPAAPAPSPRLSPGADRG
jgi:hypothetical protein